jgi:diguanylate cyclase (GGDEF)-like protein
MNSKKSLFQFNSLRSRYMGLGILLALIIAVIAWLSQAHVSSTAEQRLSTAAERNHAAQNNRVIRDDMWELEYYLQLFMLSPTRELEDGVQVKLRDALAHSDDMLGNSWVNQHNLKEDVHFLKNNLTDLQDEIANLIRIRNDIDLMYPGLKLARGELVTLHADFMTQTSLALDETSENLADANNVKVLQMLYQLRDQWLRMINAFRLSLINRLSSMFVEGIKQIERDVYFQHQNVTAILDQLQELKQQDKLGFATADAVTRLQTVALRWIDKFEELRAIHEVEFWRSDVPIMSNHIHPLLIRIQLLLKRVDQAVEASADQDVHNQAEIASGLINTLWALGLIFIAFIPISYLFFEKKLLLPVEMIARGLKEGAKGSQADVINPTSIHEIQNLVDAFKEMHRQVHSRQQALEHQAMHDSLTGLPNRILLNDRLSVAIENAKRTHRSLSLIMIDLNRFKEINDTLGHHIGDHLLVQVGHRLSNLLRGSDTVARLGGDEFAIILPDISKSHVLELASRIISELENVYEVENKPLYVGASLGIATYPEHGDSARMLLQHADVAMYDAKRANIGIALYDKNKDKHNTDQLALLTDLRHAIENDLLDIYFQPQYSIADRTITGLEALLRWNHPQLGMISPDQIIPLAEQSGVIKNLTLWILENCIIRLSKWREQKRELSLSVNISVWDLQNPMLEKHIAELLSRWRIPADSLELEITESDMMSDPERAEGVLRRLSKMGLSISIDDYGTGFSSLAYLKQLPVNTIKIDKSFVIDMSKDENDAVIVRSTIDLAHNLGFRVTAEGVENEDTLRLLEILGCDTVQGYYFTQPLSESNIMEWLDTNQRQVI